MEGRKKITEAHAKSRPVRQQQAQVFANAACQELLKICSQFSSLIYRCKEDAHKLLHEFYIRSFENALELNEPKDMDVHRYLGLPANATYKTFCQAVQAKKESDPLIKNRTLSCIESTFDCQFSWQNYQAYVQGPDAINDLPKAREHRLAKLRTRALEVKKAYEAINNKAL